MKRLVVKYRPQADQDILAIADYILDRSSNIATARAYIDRLYARERIGNVPLGGAPRDDLSPGLRMAVFERRVVILYRMENEAVWITNILSGGRDYETLFDTRGKRPPDVR